MGAPSKRAKIVRQAKEFDLGRLKAQLYMPRDGRTTIDSWSLDEIMDARTEQMLGQFVRPARMAEQFRTDDALYAAWLKRLAPQRMIPVEMEAAPGARGASIAGEAEALFGPNGVGLTAACINDIHSCLANHGVAFGVNMATPRDDGSRIDFEHRYWPIEYVRWDPVFRVFKARADPNSVQPGDIPETPDNRYGWVGGFWIPVIHGDGRWVIYKKGELEPFRQEAALLPAALIWAYHAFANRDWSKASKAHGTAKVVGELPAGVPLQNNGALTAEASAFIELLQAIVHSDAPAGIRPAGAKTDFLVNGSTAWQVFSELVLNREKAAHRVYNGTDASIGAQGGAPGIDVESLFQVEKTIISGDLEAISRGVNTGIVAPWAAVNFGDSKLAPRRRYLLPNEDQDKIHEGVSTRNAAYYAALKEARDAGLQLTGAFVAKLAEDYGVRVPELAGPIVAPPSPGGAPAQ